MARRGYKGKTIGRSERKAYTGFSRSYPGSLGGGGRLSYSEKLRRRQILKWILGSLGVLALVVLSYVVMNSLLKLSDKPADKETRSAAPTQSVTEKTTAKPAPEQKRIQAVSAQRNLLNGGTKLESFIATAKSIGVNAVAVDFKDSGGTLAVIPAADTVPGASKDAVAAAKAKESVAAFQKAGLQVIARVHCFRDPAAARVMRDAAVRLKTDGAKIWLDKSRNGQPWLNPYSEKAADYLLGVIAQTASLGVDFILLDSVQYPAASLSLAMFPGEEAPGAPAKNAALNAFVAKAKTAAGKATVICAMDAEAAVSGNSRLYDGDLWNCGADIFAVDITQTSRNVSFPKEKRVVAVVLSPDDAPGGDYILK